MSNHFRKFGVSGGGETRGLAKLILFQNCPIAAPTRDHECYNESQPRQRIIPRGTSSATALAHNQENSVSDTLLMRFDETRISLCRSPLSPQLFETLLDGNKIRLQTKRG